MNEVAWGVPHSLQPERMHVWRAGTADGAGVAEGDAAEIVGGVGASDDAGPSVLEEGTRPAGPPDASAGEASTSGGGGAKDAAALQEPWGRRLAGKKT